MEESEPTLGHGGGDAAVGWRHALAISVLAASIAFAAASDVAGGEVGTTSVVVRTVIVERDGNVRRAGPGGYVEQSEVIETADGSASEIVFLDDTIVTVGPNTRLMLDEFVFNPDPALGRFAMTSDKGVFRFDSGSLAGGAYVIRTPTVTIAVGGPAESGARGGARLVDCRVAATASPDGTIRAPVATPDWAADRVTELDGVMARSISGAGDGGPNTRRASTRCSFR
jgi:hypothetical protein